MNTLNDNAITFVLIFNDGERIVENVELADVNGRWVKASREFGAKYKSTSEYWWKLVVVCGFEVQTYTGGEIREILLGL